MKEKVYGGVMGLCVADALGLPVQFKSRESIHENPVTDMTGYGTFDLPPGSWSDDTSMTLCLMDSLSRDLDYNDIMTKFQSWLQDGEYTPYGYSYDVGRTTRRTIRKFSRGEKPERCGETEEDSNGNGSLMRTLPVAFYLHSKCAGCFSKNDEAFNTIHRVSALTHAHERSMIACGIYCVVAENLLNGVDKKTAVTDGLKTARTHYESKADFRDECKHYSRLFEGTFFELPKSEIYSSGYVVDTLEAAIWCLMNTESYKDCVLKAVNLGEDTDTVAAVAGGLAGIHYGLDAIPPNWLEQIARLDYIKEHCEAFANSL